MFKYVIQFANTANSCQIWTLTIDTVADNQSPLILWPWVFLFWTWQKHLLRLGNAGKHLFRVYWRDWHEPITPKLNIYHFESQNFGRPPKQLAKNAEKCAIDSFFRAEDDPTELDNFHKPFGIYMASKVTFSHQIWSICDHIYVWENSANVEITPLGLYREIPMSWLG